MVNKGYLKFRAKVNAQRAGIKAKESLRKNAPKVGRTINKGMKGVDNFLMGTVTKKRR